jgi:hypothetical protein
MIIYSPALDLDKEATEQDIESAVKSIQGLKDPFILIMKNEMNFAQVLWTEKGFIFEFQEISLANHYEAVAFLSADDAFMLLTEYFNNREEWKRQYTFRVKKVAGISWYLGRLWDRFCSLFKVLK